MAVAKTEKPGMFARVKKYFRTMAQEMKKVHWPSLRDLAVYTAVVIGVSLVVAVFIGLLDFGVNALMQLIYGLGG